MLSAKISDGVVVAYPYTLAQLRADHPDTSFPRLPTVNDLVAHGIMIVKSIERPATTIEQEMIEFASEFADGA